MSNETLNRTSTEVNARERELAERISRGDVTARDELVTNNFHLVKQSIGPFRDRGVDVEDLEQEGFLGLIKATETFDPEKGNFSTHARFWVKENLRMALFNKASAIRTPACTIRKVSAYKRVLRRYEEENRELKPEDLMRELSLTRKKYDRLVSSLVIARSTAPPQSDDEERSLHYETHDPENHAPWEDPAYSTKKVRQALKRLGPQEKYMMVKVFGIDREQPQSREQVGRDLGLTRSKAQTLYQKAFEKMEVSLKWAD